jgi:hypothetical protein
MQVNEGPCKFDALGLPLRGKLQYFFSINGFSVHANSSKENFKNGKGGGRDCAVDLSVRDDEKPAGRAR